MCQSESYNWGYSFVNYFANVLFKKNDILYAFHTFSDECDIQLLENPEN